jgi:hypothetical protein
MAAIRRTGMALDGTARPTARHLFRAAKKAESDLTNTLFLATIRGLERVLHRFFM